jgi:hypothetical protein
MLLNPAKQFLGLAFGALEFVAHEFGLFLFQLALDDLNVALDFECFHINFMILAGNQSSAE